jgi:hypothetical protein
MKGLLIHMGVGDENGPTSILRKRTSGEGL